MRKIAPIQTNTFIVVRTTHFNGVLIEQYRYLPGGYTTRDTADSVAAALNTQTLSGLDGFSFTFHSLAV